MRRTRDARVVVADRLLAAPLQVVVIEIKSAFDDAAQILFDRELILRRRRHDPCVQDVAVVVDLVLVQQ